jgi:hypothetical protein
MSPKALFFASAVLQGIAAIHGTRSVNRLQPLEQPNHAHAEAEKDHDDSQIYCVHGNPPPTK